MSRIYLIHVTLQDFSLPPNLECWLPLYWQTTRIQKVPGSTSTIFSYFKIIRSQLNHSQQFTLLSYCGVTYHVINDVNRLGQIISRKIRRLQSETERRRTKFILQTLYHHCVSFTSTSYIWVSFSNEVFVVSERDLSVVMQRNKF